MMAKKRVELASDRYRKKRVIKEVALSASLSEWGTEPIGGDDAGGAGGGGHGEEGSGGGGAAGTEGGQGPEITGELDPNAQAEMIAARVQRDMKIVRDLLDTTHTKLSEMDLFSVKNARRLDQRINSTDDRTKEYDHESHEYEIGKLNRAAAEQEQRLVELNAILDMQRVEMAKRDAMLAEQTALVLESSESIKLFEGVLTKKQRALLMKKREQMKAGGEVGGDDEEEVDEGNGEVEREREEEGTAAATPMRKRSPADTSV